MIDIHAHILPGVDDGSPSMEDSLEMAVLATESGVSTMIVTPHCNLPRTDCLDTAGVTHACAELSAALRAHGSTLRLSCGMEIFGTPDTALRLREGSLCTLAGSRYPLVEFPFSDYAHEATGILREILELGLRPIVAHPERYLFAQAEPRLLNLWTDMGCLLQVNRGSLLGRFGRREQALAFALVERGFASFVASDAHSPLRRTPWMHDVYTLLCSEFSVRTADLLLKENPGRVLGNQQITLDEPDWFD